jgi:hypothetical protein
MTSNRCWVKLRPTGVCKSCSVLRQWLPLTCRADFSPPCPQFGRLKSALQGLPALDNLARIEESAIAKLRALVTDLIAAVSSHSPIT